MLSKTMEQNLNEHMNEEFYSFYIYLAMAAYLDAHYLKGMAHWMRLQASEEMNHAMKFFGYLQERSATVTLLAIKKPPKEWSSVLAAFQAAMTHEQSITAKIGSLVEKAQGEKDHATENFLQWFVKEQVEEESTLDPIVHRLQLSGENVAALYVLDRELGMRASS
jgi:ferritin